MRLPEVEIIKARSLQSGGDNINRWVKWANSIANRFRRSTSRIFPLELFFLNRSPQILAIPQKWACMARLINFSMPLILKPILTHVSRHFVNKNFKLFGTASNSRNQNKESKLLDQDPLCVESSNIIRHKASRYKASGEYFGKSLNLSPLKRIENSAFLGEPSENHEKAEFLQISQKWKRKEIGNLSYYGPGEQALMSPLDNSRYGNSLDVNIKPINAGDGSRIDTIDYQFSDKYPPTIYRRFALSNIEGKKPTQTLPHTPGSRAYDSIQRTELSQPVNVDHITEEVIRKIDHKLLVWRERTGRV